MKPRTIGIMLIVVAVCLLLIASGFALTLTPLGKQFIQAPPTATPVPIPFTPIPTQRPTPILTAEGKLPTLSATAVYLLDDDTGQTLADINGETPLPMASTTKILTAVIAIEAADPNQLVTIHQDAINEVIQNSGSSAQLVVGDKIPLEQLLYGLMLPSGDDAAVAIADAVSGTTENFVHIMNIFAHHLHLFQTHYINPDGLNAPGHYTSAYDLVRLAQYAMTLSFFAQLVQTQQYILPASSLHHKYIWKTTNQLLSTYKGATGIKTGTTPEAGFCLVFSATRKGHRLIGVLLHSTDEQHRFSDAEALLNWGFGLPLILPTT